MTRSGTVLGTVLAVSASLLAGFGGYVLCCLQMAPNTSPVKIQTATSHTLPETLDSDRGLKQALEAAQKRSEDLQAEVRNLKASNEELSKRPNLDILDVGSSREVAEAHPFCDWTKAVVLIEIDKTLLDTHSIDARQVQTDVELKLRQAGLKIVEAKDVDANTAFFYISTVSLQVRDDVRTATYICASAGCAFSLVTTQGRASLKMPTLWTNGTILVLGSQRLDQIRASAKDLTDMFCNKYLQAKQSAGR